MKIFKERLTIKIQCTYNFLHTGTFLVNKNGIAKSPIFVDSVDTLYWLQKHFIYQWDKGFSIVILKTIKKPDVNSFGIPYSV